MNEVWVIRSTFAGKDEAVLAARALIEERLAACANIEEPVTSLYHWEDMMQSESETVLILKTTRRQLDAAMQRLKELHTYKIPSILSWQARADRDFALWVDTETQ